MTIFLPKLERNTVKLHHVLYVVYRKYLFIHNYAYVSLPDCL